MGTRRRVRRLPANFYSSKLMSAEDRAELRRAGKVVGLADEIALLRVRLKRAAEDQEDIELIEESVRLMTEVIEAKGGRVTA